MCRRRPPNYRRFIDEALVGGNVDLVDELVAPKFIEHEAT